MDFFENSDSVALDAVNEITSLTNGLSRNIWQKIMLLDRMESSRDESHGSALSGSDYQEAERGQRQKGVRSEWHCRTRGS